MIGSGVAWGGNAARVRLAGAAAPARLPRLAVESAEFVDDRWRAYHAAAAAPGAFDLACRGPASVRLNGPGLIWADGQLLDDAEILPVYVRPELDRAESAIIRDADRLPVRRDGRLALVFHGWGVRVYGHFLIEMLPKLLLARRFAALFGDALPVLDRAMPDWFLGILQAHLGVDLDRAIWFDSASEQLELDRAVILPLLTRAAGYHPVVGGLVDAFVARVAVRPVVPIQRIFLARGDFVNAAAPKRLWANEAELAAVAVDRFGFAVVHPERLGFAEQVGLFAGAEVIVGQAGSGMHNALFAPAGASVGVVRFTAPDQSAIAALRGQRIGYLTVGVEESEVGVFRAEIGRFERFLARLLLATGAVCR